MSRGLARSADERERLIAEWTTNELSVPVFAKQVGVPASTFYQWLGQRRRAAKARSPRVARVIRAAAVPPVPRKESELVVEVGKARVRVPMGFDQGLLASVLQVLGGQAGGAAS